MELILEWRSCTVLMVSSCVPYTWQRRPWLTGQLGRRGAAALHGPVVSLAAATSAPSWHSAYVWSPRPLVLLWDKASSSLCTRGPSCLWESSFAFNISCFLSTAALADCLYVFLMLSLWVHSHAENGSVAISGPLIILSLSSSHVFIFFLPAVSTRLSDDPDLYLEPGVFCLPLSPVMPERRGWNSSLRGLCWPVSWRVRWGLYERHFFLGPHPWEALDSVETIRFYV